MAIDKPAGFTSRAVLNRICRVVGERRAGHAGTLDPAASGVLVVAFGEATKVVRWLMHSRKSYRAVVSFGTETSTDDAEGEVTRSAPLPGSWSTECIKEAAAAPMGPIEQVPPAVSALKKDGVRDHERVRRGETIERVARTVQLHAVRLIEVNADTATFELDVGSGFYVRAWARDLGRKLGTAAHLKSLRRTACAGFPASQAVTLEHLEALGERSTDELIGLAEAMRALMPVVAADAPNTLALQRGQLAAADINFGEWGPQDTVFVVDSEGQPVCIANATAAGAPPNHQLRVVRGFHWVVETAPKPPEIA